MSSWSEVGVLTKLLMLISNLPKIQSGRMGKMRGVVEPTADVESKSV